MAGITDANYGIASPIRGVSKGNTLGTRLLFLFTEMSAHASHAGPRCWPGSNRKEL